MLDLTPNEAALFAQVPNEDLALMAVELDMLLDEQIDRDTLLVRCLAALLDRAELEGLPLSKYDADDLAALPPAHLQALGRHVGLRGSITVKSLVRHGAKTWRQYRKNRPKSATALLVPLLLGALARGALIRQQGLST